MLQYQPTMVGCTLHSILCMWFANSLILTIHLVDIVIHGCSHQKINSRIIQYFKFDQFLCLSFFSFSFFSSLSFLFFFLFFLLYKVQLLYHFGVYSIIKCPKVSLNKFNSVQRIYQKGNYAYPFQCLYKLLSQVHVNHVRFGH